MKWRKQQESAIQLKDLKDLGLDYQTPGVFSQRPFTFMQSQIKSKLNEWYEWLVNQVPKTVQSKVNGAHNALKDKIEALWKNNVEKEAQKEHEQDQEVLGLDAKDQAPRVYNIIIEKVFVYLFISLFFSTWKVYSLL